MIEGSPRILIIRLSSIGDVVRVMPAMHALRDFYPNARIDWAVERKSAGILKGHPDLDALIVYERVGTGLQKFIDFYDFLRRLRRNQYDLVIDFHGIFKSGLASLASGARERHAFAHPRGQELSPLCANRHVKLPSQSLNRVEENLALIEPLVGRPKKVDFAMWVPPEVHDSIDVYFEDQFGGGKFVAALHAPVERRAKQWPLERFAELADFLLSDGRFDVILSYGPGQRSIAEQIIALTRRKPSLAPETPDLMHYAWLIHRCHLYVGGDTGPMHIATAMGTPVVAIFGGTPPDKHQPYGTPCEVLYAGPERNSILGIDAESVYDACIRLMAGGPGNDGSVARQSARPVKADDAGQQE